MHIAHSCAYVLHTASREHLIHTYIPSLALSRRNDHILNTRADARGAEQSVDMPSANEIGVQGSYGRLAALMGNLPELAIFRKFHEINIQNLLTMQSELVHLEEEYKDICEEDANSECEITRSYQKDWKALQKSKGMGGTLQKDAQSRLQVKLAAYSKISLPRIQQL